jgi:hypothetical protein
MCFPIGEIKVAKRDIPVWKVFMSYNGKNIVTPWQERPFSEVVSRKVEVRGDKGYGSLATRAGGKKIASEFVSVKVLIIRLFIPKGSKYGVGLFSLWGEKYKAYRSDRLIGSKMRGK